MRKTTLLLFTFTLLAVLLPIQTAAQDKSTKMAGPPKVLQIGREEVKPGKGAAHEKLEAAWSQALISAKYPTYYLAMTSATGPNEVWFLAGFDSFTDWEKDAKSFENAPVLRAVSQKFTPQESEFLSQARNIVAKYRADLSYRPEINLGEMRYFSVRTVRIRLGHDSEYAELRKLINGAREKANLDEHSVVYQVLSGTSNGTYLVFTPFRSAAEFEAVLGSPTTNQAYQDAMGDEGRQKLTDLIGKAVVSSEDTLFAFSPKMSSPSPTTVAADPGYWQPKHGMTQKDTTAANDSTPAAKIKPVKR